MTIQRSTIKTGPAVILMAGQKIYSQGDIQVATRLETFPVNVSTAGKTDERVKDVVTEIQFTPSGEWTPALLAVLFPYTNPSIGSSMFGAVDVPVVIHPMDGAEEISYPAAAITKMPDLILSNTKTALGQMTITCLGKDNTALNDAAKRHTITDPAPAFTDSYDINNVPTVPYAVSLVGESAPWNAIKTLDGVTVSFNLGSQAVDIDDEGIVDYHLTGLEISVKFKPVGITVAQILDKLKVQGAGFRRGLSLGSSAADILITGGSGLPEVTVNKVALRATPQAYGQEAYRHGEIELVATRPSGTGAMFVVGNGA